MSGVTGAYKVEVLEELGIVELFLKRKSGARETGDEDNGRFGRVACSVGPDLSAVLGPHKLSERGHEEGIQALTGYREKRHRDG